MSWWKKYIGSATGVTKLSRNELEKLLVASSEQVEKMQKQQFALESEITDLSAELRRKQILDQNRPLLVDMKDSEVCPTNYAASRQREMRLESQLLQLQGDYERLVESIEFDTDILRQMMSLYKVEQTIPKSSLKIAPFNNSDIRKIYTFLEMLKKQTHDPFDVEDVSLAIYLLSGDSKIIGSYFYDMKQKFEYKREEMESLIDELTNEGNMTIKRIRKLHEGMDNITKKLESITPQLPSYKKDIVRQISELGDTHLPLEKAENVVEQLRSVKEKLKNECVDLSNEMLSKPLDSKDYSPEIQESVLLRQKLMMMEMEINEQKHREICLKSQIDSSLETIRNAENDTKQIMKQTQRVEDTTEAFILKKERLEGISMNNEDVRLIQKLCPKTNPDEIEEYVNALREKYENTKKRKKALKKRVEQMRHQNDQFKVQILEMKLLLASGTI